MAILADTFQIEVLVKQFQGQWIHLDKSDQTKMGHAPLGSVLNNRLGMDTVAGSRIWSVENRFQIVLGPLRYSAFMDFRQLDRCCRNCWTLYELMSDPTMILTFELFLIDVTCQESN